MKRILIGIFFMAVALSTSAYVSAIRHGVGTIYVQETYGVYTEIDSWSYMIGVCVYDTYNNAPCSVQVTPQGYYNNVEIYAPFTEDEVYEYLLGPNPWLVVLDSHEKLFIR